MLNALVVLIEETQDELQIEGEFSIRVNPPREGSVDIPLQIFLFGATATLFTFNPGLSKVLDTLKSLFDLKQYFKGEQPSEKAIKDGVSVGNIMITGGTNIINIVNQPRVDAALDQAAQDLEKDESLTGVKLVNKSTGEEIVDLPRETFRYLRSPEAGQLHDVPSDRVRKVETLLTVHSPVLEGTAKWKFVYEGRQISASIKDEEFLKEVTSGVEAFRNGDRLKVKLEIGEKFVAAIQDYERTNKFAIREVFEHIPRPKPPKQLSLISEQSDSEE